MPMQPTLSPSGLLAAEREGGRAMTADEMDDLAEAYIRAAEDAMAIGADGVEVHAAHGYLMDQFLWAETNTRGDGHGGPAIEDRARYPLRVAAALRQAVGPDALLSFRFSQFKEVDYGARVFETPSNWRPSAHWRGTRGSTCSTSPRVASASRSGRAGSRARHCRLGPGSFPACRS